MNFFEDAFSGRTVLVTGHTGFKGSWLSLWLTDLGAKVVGYALPPDTTPSLFNQLELAQSVDSRIGDIRDAVLLEKTLRETRPEVVFHLAAQPLVRESYERPAETFAVNALGTANLLDAVRRAGSVKACLVITTDKCYENPENGRAFREDDRLGGRDPYSASKACVELIVASYRAAFFSSPGAASVASARAGNVIGGGDWAKDRLLPDCARSLAAGRPVSVRNPKSVRPWQHVLEPLSGYLRLAARQLAEPARHAEAWNFGPQPGRALSVGEVTKLAVKVWGSGSWLAAPEDPAAPHEAGQLYLDSTKAEQKLGWLPVYGAAEAVERTIAWYLAAREPGFDARGFTMRQIAEYAVSARGAETRR